MHNSFFIAFYITYSFTTLSQNLQCTFRSVPHTSEATLTTIPVGLKVTTSPIDSTFFLFKPQRYNFFCIYANNTAVFQKKMAVLLFRDTPFAIC